MGLVCLFCISIFSFTFSVLILLNRLYRTEDETLELKCIFEGHSLGVVSVDISNDGRYAVSSSLDCHIRFWDLDNGAPAQDMAEKIDAGPTDSWTVCFSPDTSLVATGCQGGKINLFSTETGKLVKKLDTTAKFALSVAFVSKLDNLDCIYNC